MLNKHLLVIDDNLTLLEMFTDLLSLHDYKVTALSTGKGALTVIESLHPALVIIDIMLDGYDGREICKEMKQHKTLQHIPVILVSAGYRSAEIIYEQWGCDAFLEKPFNITELILEIEDQIKAYQHY